MEFQSVEFSLWMRRVTLGWALLLCVQHVTLTPGTEGSSVPVERTFHKLTNLHLGTSRLTSSWISPSLTTCVARCLARFPSSCQSVIYHADLQLCTPGSQVTFDLPVPNAATEGDLYSAALTCDTTDGFSLQSGFGQLACVKILPLQTGHKQRIECSSLGGHLASTRTLEKLYLIQNFAGSVWTLVGLDDLVSEDTFVWHDTGLVMTADEKTSLFNTGEPNDDTGEDCVICNANSRLNDIPCSRSYPAVCERPLQ